MNRLLQLPVRGDTRPIFQAKHLRGPLTKVCMPMQHVEDARVATQNMTKRQDKVDYFLSIGLDFDRVEKYYPTICALNDQWDQATTAMVVSTTIRPRPWKTRLPPFLK